MPIACAFINILSKNDLDRITSKLSVIDKATFFKLISNIGHMMMGIRYHNKIDIHALRVSMLMRKEIYLERGTFRG